MLSWVRDSDPQALCQDAEWEGGEGDAVKARVRRRLL